eukprot:scaffold84183_cov69-Phaeocystis_antarctica.AAC.1
MNGSSSAMSSISSALTLSMPGELLLGTARRFRSSVTVLKEPGTRRRGGRVRVRRPSPRARPARSSPRCLGPSSRPRVGVPPPALALETPV